MTHYCNLFSSPIAARCVPLLLLLCLFIMPAGNTARAQNGYTVTDIDFAGNKTYSDSQLKKRITLHSAGLIKRLISKTEPSEYSDSDFEDDQQRLIRFYQRHGFLNATVTRGDFTIDAEDREVKIVFQIQENDPVTVDSISLIYNGVDSALARRMIDSSGFQPAQFSLNNGVRFEDSLLRNDRTVLLTRLHNLGFPYANANPQLRVDQSAMTVSIHWRITSGPLSSFGSITITGNENIDDVHIRKQLAFASGDRYKKKQLQATREQIYNLNVFDIVTINAELDDPPDSIIDVSMRLSESPQFTTRIGAGYGREDNFRVFLDTRIRRVFGSMYQFNIYAKHSGLVPYELDLRLVRPAFLTPRTTLIINPGINRQKEPGFTQTRFVGNLALQHFFSPDLESSGLLTYERLDLDPGSVSQKEITEEELQRILDTYNRLSVRFETIWDKSQPRFDPRRGFFLASSFKLSGIVFESVSEYGKLIVDMRKYIPWGDLVLASRIKIGGIDAYRASEFIPFDDRFYSGGSHSVRGWSRSKLGPLDDDGQPVGGSSLLEFSLETRFPIFGIVSGVVFSDWGNVWRGSYSYHFDDLRYSAGAGLRFTTLAGKIRADFARPVFDDEKTWQFHLSIGPAF